MRRAHLLADDAGYLYTRYVAAVTPAIAFRWSLLWSA